MSKRIISLGAGVQSTAIVLLAEKGIISADFIIFADTGNESASTYSHLEYLKTKTEIPIITVKNGNILDDLYRYTESDSSNWTGTPPFWITDRRGKGRLRQQCSKFYKIQPIKKWIRENIGRKEETEVLLGISTDEIIRIKPSEVKYIRHRYPLIELRYSRKFCIDLLKKSDWNVPEKSGCLICPFGSANRWMRLTAEERKILTEADEKIRNGILYDKKDRKYFLSSRFQSYESIIKANESQRLLFEQDSEEYLNSCESGHCFV